MVHLKVLHLEAAAAAPAEPSSLKSQLLKRKVTLQTWRKFWRKKWRTFNRYLIKVWQRFGEISTKVWPLFDESWRKDEHKTEEIKYFDWKLLKKNVIFFLELERVLILLFSNPAAEAFCQERILTSRLLPFTFKHHFLKRMPLSPTTTGPGHTWPTNRTTPGPSFDSSNGCTNAVLQ
jgi:hypothetical protein